MQNKSTLKKIAGLFSKSLLFLGLVLWCASLSAQTISTLTGTNYLGNYSINNPNPLIQTFAVNNTNATSRVLSDVTMQMAPYFGNSGASTITLYYSSTSLGGPPSVLSPDWTVVGTGNVTVPDVLTDITVLTGLNFIIPANTEYRFAIEATKGITFSVTPTPTPNIFTVGGISLEVGDYQIAGGNVGFAGLSPTPNPANTPTFFGGSVTFTTNTPCSGTPDPGNTIASVPSVCPASPVALSIQNATVGTGVTYQWQSSSAATGPFADVATGGTFSTYLTTQTTDTYYQVLVTCGGVTTASTPVLVSMTPSSGCYCIPTISDCTDGDIITNVTLNTLNNTSGCSTDGFINYGDDPSVVIPDVVAGVANPITVTAGTGQYDEGVAVWIDFDHNGLFDASEFTTLGISQTGAPLTANINVPADAVLGQARMRVRVQFLNEFLPGEACASAFVDFGETEDYFVNVIPCVQGVFDQQPVSTPITCGNSAVFTANVSGSLIAFQWQEKTGTVWNNVVDGGNYSGATTNTLTLLSVDGSMTGTQYRLVISGGCTAVDFSDVVTLDVAPVVILVNPASYSTCSPIPANAPVPLSITNVNGGIIATTLTLSSGPLNTLIPDDDPAGIINTITVPALPAGATIVSAKVTLNIEHTFMGDLSINLKAPNNNILNLDYFLTGTFGDITTGFTNTEISSTGVNAISSGVDPWTGVFAADGVVTPPAGFPPTGATSIGDANVSTFPGLYSTPEGDWTIGIYDAGALDEGHLLDWTLSITYTNSSTSAVEGVWTPVTGLFTDAAGTTPYVAGTLANTVYAAPGSTTVYTVTVDNAICPSDPVEVPVTILAADPVVTITAAPATNIYPGIRSVLTATVTPALSTTGTYQWLQNGTEIPGATASTYEVTFANTGLGDYSVDVIDPAICSGRVGSNSITISDSARNQLFIWPNPSTGQFQVRFFDGINDIISGSPYLVVFDSKGSRILTQKIDVSAPNNVPYARMDVDLSGQPKGTYIVSLFTAAGKLLQTGRVIVR